MSSTPAPSTAGPVVVLFAERRASPGLRDRFKSPEVVHGHGFESYRGAVLGLNDRREVVALVPSDRGAVDFERLVEGVLRAHRPDRLIGAGFAQAVDHEALAWAPLAAVQVRSPGQDPIEVLAPRPIRSIAAGAFQQTPEGAADAEGDVIAVNQWCYSFAAACQGDALLLAVNERADTDVPSDVANVEGRPTLAGKAGALTRLLWKRPSDVRTLWSRQEAAWEGQERLADALIDAIRRYDVEPQSGC